jgi:adenosylcobinamide kinase/adenosylcobinamide-phosphate guanylyltransferase
MNILVTGGAASGKSAYAERRALDLGGSPIYVATMRVNGTEDEARVRRHRGLRDGTGFATAECPTPGALEDAALALPDDATVLLEDLGNLVADGLFTLQGDMRQIEEAHREIARAIATVEQHAAHLVVVGNEVGCGIAPDTDEMRAYIGLLGRIACEYAATCDEVVECVCGIPQIISNTRTGGAA